MSTDIMTNEELLALLSQTQRKLADVEVRLEQAEITIRETNDLLDAKTSRMQSADERIAVENFLAEEKRHEQGKENARMHGASTLRNIENGRRQPTRIRSVFRALLRDADAFYRESDARQPPRGTVVYDQWRREREPWDMAVQAIERGTASLGGWDSDLLVQRLRDAGIPETERQARCRMQTLNTIIKDFDKRLATVEREAAAWGLTLEDLRKVETNWTPT